MSSTSGVFNYHLFFIGFGAVAKALLTLMSRLNYTYSSLTIIEQYDIFESDIIQKITSKDRFASSEEDPEHILYNSADRIRVVRVKLDPLNYQTHFARFLVPDHSFVVDLAYRTSTGDLILECWKHNALYVNTAIDDWHLESETLAEIKDMTLKKLKALTLERYPTALVNNGFNPGFVSNLAKELLVYVAEQKADYEAAECCQRDQYNKAAERLGLELLQISERDTQHSRRIRTNGTSFVNTWSVIGLIDELFDPVQISWGTHEKKVPMMASKLTAHGQRTLPVRADQIRTLSYEPEGGELYGVCIPHAESYSLMAFLRTPTYRPSIYYSYLPPDDAKLVGYYWMDEDPEQAHVLRSDEILPGGYDSVGVLGYFQNGQVFWYGSTLTNEFAQTISDEVNATSIQVAISVLAGMEWCVQHPFEGIVEPEALDSEFVIEFCRPFLGDFDVFEVTKDEYNPPGHTFYDLAILPKQAFQ